MLLNGVRAARPARQVFSVALIATFAAMVAATAAPATHTVSAPPAMVDVGADTGAEVRLAFAHPPPRAKPGPKGSIETSGVRLRAVLAEGAPTVAHGIEWQVWPFGEADNTTVSTDSIAEVELPPGRYIARVSGGLAAAETDFEVEYDKVTRMTVTLDAGAIEASVVPGAATMPLDLASVTLRRAGENGETLVNQIGGRLDVVLPAGTYELDASLGLVSASRTVEVRAGTTARTELTLEIGFIVAEAVAAEGTDPLSEATFSLTRNAGADAGNELARASGRRGIFAVAPGEYQLTGRYGLAEVEEMVRVTPNALTQVTMTLDAAHLELAALGPEMTAGRSAARFRILRSNGAGPPEVVTDIVGERPALRLPAGNFVVEAERDGVSASDHVALTAGERKTVNLVLGGGEIDVRPLAAAGLIDGARIELSAMSGNAAAGELVDLGTFDGQPVRLPAGEYHLFGRLVPGGARSQTPVQVSQGERAAAELRFDVGAARLAMFDKPDGTALENVHWVLRPVGETHAISATGGVVQFALPPGRYRVHAEAGGKEASGEIEVVVGASSDLIVVPD